MKKTKRIIYIIMIFTFLFISSMLSTSVYSYRSVTNDVSNLINYPTIYTLVQELKTAHPTWNFTMLYTGLDWNSVIANETTALHTRSLVYKTLPTGNIEEWVCGVCKYTLYDSQNWYCASGKTVSYYMDPRNWLNENYIFSFESLGNNSSINKVEGIKAILKGTFMDTDTITYIDTAGKQQTINKSYAQVIMEAAEKYNVSPYLLASRMKQEQGTTGSSTTSGATFNYIYRDPKTNKVIEEFTCTGRYNFFNIGASGNSPEEITYKGLKYAKGKGWTTPELSIHGGAKFLKEEYIDEHQDSLYLQKYDIDTEGGHTYLYQYMQNVSAPYTEGLSVRSAYKSLNLLESGFNFIIPVYENMPTNASAKPGRSVKAVTESVKINTKLMGLTLRDKPSSSGDFIVTMPKGTIVTRIETAVEADESSGEAIYWDKVVYNDGSTIKIGYATREYLAKVETTPTVSEEYTVSQICNLRNGPATTQTTVKQILDVGTPVTVIDKMTFKVDGHTWYRVKLTDGTEGYVSSAYIGVTAPAERYRIEGENIKISPSTTTDEIPGVILMNEKLKTNGTVIIEGIEYKVVMLGDINGDGTISPADYVKIKNNIMGTTKLTKAYKLAADVNSDGDITPADYVKVKNHIMKSSKISL